jgi:hypothetical protein
VSRDVEGATRGGAVSAAPPPGGSAIRFVLALAVLLALAATACPAASSRVRDRLEPPDPLCGITPPVDDLLRCDESAAPPGGPPPEAQAAAQQQTDQLPVQEPHAAAATPRYLPGLLLVRFRRGTSPHRQAETLAGAGVTLESRIGALGVVVVRMPPDRRDSALDRLRASRFVAGAGKDAVVELLDTVPNDTDWSAQWGLRRIDLPSAWDLTRGSAQVVVAVLDTGVDFEQPDLQGALLAGSNVLDPARAASDDNGHGTAVAGIIAARANNHSGIAGICWACSILPIKVLGADGTGDTAGVAAGIVRAADAGARVISMSLGGPVDDPTLDAAVAYATGKGAILVAAAGNNGGTAPFYPAASPGVISVAGTDESDRLYSWSNFGGWVQVAAPGCNAAPALSGGYVLFCGTSSATPVVAGLTALALSVQPTAGREAIVGAIESGATRIGDGVSRGRVDAAATLAALGAVAAGPQRTVPKTVFSVKGILRARDRARVYRRALVAESIVATVTFRGARTLTLAIRNEVGALVARAGGPSPLRVARVIPAGRYSFAVTGRRTRTAFSLVVERSG